MNQFVVVTISTEVAQYVRTNRKSPVYGFPAHKEIAAGRAPCRHCLQLIHVQEEELLLFIYDPFREVGAPPMPGPVYIHAQECDRHKGEHSFPAVYQGRLLTFDAHSEEGELLKTTFLKGGAEEETANRLFAIPEVQYIHVRSTEAGCFLFRLERA